MAFTNYIVIYDTSGNQKALITDYYKLNVSAKINDSGLLEVELLASSPWVQYFVDDAQVEHRREDFANQVSTPSAFYLVRKYQYYTNQDGINYVKFSCLGIRSILGRRIVAWAGLIEDRSTFTQKPAETIMKNLINYNLGSLALTQSVYHGMKIGRARVGTISGVTSETDAGHGPLLDWKCAWKNVLTELQALSRLANSDFDFIRTSGTTYSFHYCNGPLGIDRTSTVSFSLALGNMVMPKYTLDKTTEATVAIVGGRNYSTNRRQGIYTGVNYNATTNNIEMWVDARESDTDQYMESKAQERLFAAQSRNKLEFQVKQNEGTVYGRDYFLGDLVTAYYAGITFTQKIIGVNISVDASGQEIVGIDLKDTNTGPITIVTES